MLDAMRRSARSFGMKLVLMMIVLTFVFMGAGSFLTRSPDELATVNGDPVTFEEFQAAHNNIMENLRRQFGGNIDDEFLRMINVERQALNSLIDQKLLIQVAEENSLRVTDEMLADAIARMPAFQSNGRFNQEQYNRMLRQNRLSPQRFEKLQKESMLTNQIRNFIVSNVAVSESEARAWFEWENTEIDVEYAVFSPEEIESVAVSEEEIRAYYEENQDQYRVPAQVKARYVAFHPDDFALAEEVSDEEVTDYYQRNQGDYETPETAVASHILIRVPDDADQQTIDEKREKAWDLYEKASEEETGFADLARNHSDCPSSEEGGHLGSFTRNDMVPPFSDAAFSLEPGEISEPVQTDFGWHVILLEDLTPASTPPLEAVADDIREQLARERAGDVAYRRAIEMYDISFDGDDLVENAGRLGYDVHTTDFFTRDEGPDALTNGRTFAESAFELPMEQVSDILEINQAYYLLQPIDRKESRTPDLADVEADVRKDLEAEKRVAAARETAGTFLETARDVRDEEPAVSLMETAALEERTAAATGLFTRNDPVPGFGQAAELRQAIFSLSDIGDIHDEVIRLGDRFMIIRLAARVIPGEEAFAENREETVRRLRARKQQETFERWMDKLRAESEITVSEQFQRQYDL